MSLCQKPLQEKAELAMLREKIKQVADEMGYVGVKSTQNRGGNTIGVLIPSKFINPNGSFYWALYNALVTRLKKRICSA